MITFQIGQLLNYTRRQASRFASNHIMFTMGNDFNYMSGIMWFKNMDKMIKWVACCSENLKKKTRCEGLNVQVRQRDGPGRQHVLLDSVVLRQGSQRCRYHLANQKWWLLPVQQRPALLLDWLLYFPACSQGHDPSREHCPPGNLTLISQSVTNTDFAVLRGKLREF